MNKARELYNRVKYFIQRGKRGWADCDVWDLDYYLCNLISQAASHLKATASGCPPELFDKDASNQSWKWEKVLDDIIEGFSAGKEILDEKTLLNTIEKIEDYQREYKRLMKKFNKGMKLFKQYFFYLWD